MGEPGPVWVIPWAVLKAKCFLKANSLTIHPGYMNLWYCMKILIFPTRCASKIPTCLWVQKNCECVWHKLTGSGDAIRCRPHSCTELPLLITLQNDYEPAGRGFDQRRMATPTRATSHLPKTAQRLHFWLSPVAQVQDIWQSPWPDYRVKLKILGLPDKITPININKRVNSYVWMLNLQEVTVYNLKFGTFLPPR